MVYGLIIVSAVTAAFVFEVFVVTELIAEFVVFLFFFVGHLGRNVKFAGFAYFGKIVGIFFACVLIPSESP